MAAFVNSPKEHTIDEFQGILDYIKKIRGIDFNVYRTTTITRRLAGRLQTTEMPDYISYFQFLKEDPKEMEALIDAFTIKVSRFFRNPFVFDALRDFVLPELIETYKNSSLRIWCVGCSRGEEAYSIAILIKEIFGKEAETTNTFIIATDIDSEALAYAEKAVYKSEALHEVKKGYLDKYFIKESDDRYILKDEIKSMVTFACHDATRCEPPKTGIFSDYHLILCRNLLIYFMPETQQKILNSFSASLLSGGYLVLGEAETISAPLAGNFHEIMPRTKIFRKGGISK